MKILITAASSYLGARIYFDLEKKYEVVGTYNTSKISLKFIQMDVTNRDEVFRIFELNKPDLIIHAAANPNARWCEENPEIAKKINVGGTRNVVDAANAIGAKLVYISTLAALDKSFVYGRTKFLAEEAAKETKAGFIILRPSVIIGMSPNTANLRPFFNRILKNLDEKTPAIYDISWKFHPTWIGHISEVIENVIEKKIKDEIITITVSELKSRFDVARDILSEFGISAEPKNDNDKVPPKELDQTKLKEFGMPVYSYSEIIEKIIGEIKNREKFKL